MLASVRTLLTIASEHLYAPSDCRSIPRYYYGNPRGSGPHGLTWRHSMPSHAGLPGSPPDWAHRRHQAPCGPSGVRDLPLEGGPKGRSRTLLGRAGVPRVGPGVPHPPRPVPWRGPWRPVPSRVGRVGGGDGRWCRPSGGSGGGVGVHAPDDLRHCRRLPLRCPAWAEPFDVHVLGDRPGAVALVVQLADEVEGFLLGSVLD